MCNGKRLPLMTLLKLHPLKARYILNWENVLLELTVIHAIKFIEQDQISQVSKQFQDVIS